MHSGAGKPRSLQSGHLPVEGSLGKVCKTAMYGLILHGSGVIKTSLRLLAGITFQKHYSVAKIWELACHHVLHTQQWHPHTLRMHSKSSTGWDFSFSWISQIGDSRLFYMSIQLCHQSAMSLYRKQWAWLKDRQSAMMWENLASVLRAQFLAGSQFFF